MQCSIYSIKWNQKPFQNEGSRVIKRWMIHSAHGSLSALSLYLGATALSKKKKKREKAYALT